MRVPRALLPAPALLAALAAFPLAAAGPASPHDVTSYPVVWSVPAADSITPKKGIRYGDGEYALDLYLPPGAKAQAPVVIFANHTGIDFREWEIYRSWGRLVAAHGMAGVVYQGGRFGAAARKSLDAVVAWVGARGAAEGLDPSRVAVWACSGNVNVALPWLMNGAPPSVTAAVLYYGGTPVPKTRADLPVLYVMAGRDAPELDETIRSLFAQAIREGAPWEMVTAPTLTHAFDALDEGVESKRRVKETVAWLVDRLIAPPPAGPPPDPARSALTHVFGHELREAADGYRGIVAKDPSDAAARRALGNALLKIAAYDEAIALFEKELGSADAAARRNALYNIACAHALAGRKEDALARLAQAVEAGFGPREAIERDNDLSSLRGDVRFVKILEQVKGGD